MLTLSGLRQLLLRRHDRTPGKLMRMKERVSPICYLRIYSSGNPPILNLRSLWHFQASLNDGFWLSNETKTFGSREAPLTFIIIASAKHVTFISVCRKIFYYILVFTFYCAEPVGLALDLEDYHPSVLLHCWLGLLTCKIVSEMTYDVSSGTLYPTIPSCLSIWGKYRTFWLYPVCDLLMHRIYVCMTKWFHERINVRSKVYFLLLVPLRGIPFRLNFVAHLLTALFATGLNNFIF